MDPKTAKWMEALASGGTRSHLYDPGHFHEHRKVESAAARVELKARDRALVQEQQ